VLKPFGDQKLNMVKFCGLRRYTAEFLALSRPNSESAETKFLAAQ